MYDIARDFLCDVKDAHIWLHGTFKVRKHPQILITSWYQDGIQHALERILRLRKSGEPSDLHQQLQKALMYNELAENFRRDGLFSDAAYCEGYSNALFLSSLGPEERRFPPIFFHFGGFETSSRTAYKRALGKLPDLHKTAHRYLVKMLSKYPGQVDFVLDHRPQISLDRYVTD
jgi:hypothetical protein